MFYIIMMNCTVTRAEALCCHLMGHIKSFYSRKMPILKDETIGKCLVVSSHVTTLKHKVEEWLICQKRLFVCFQKQLKEPQLAAESRTAEPRGTGDATLTL